MKNSVWNWVNGNQDAKQATFKVCSRPGCGRRETETFKFADICSVCLRVSYCSTNCQDAHQRAHDRTCKQDAMLGLM
ncbi:hypothetical protein DFP72DRAFT_911892 [Ephemerocybe angulata]|uniref:MYND-type domain-containing protein n=1 Tax=Ephemerocybe angulata TaxID=980116 RepID=A0A8H6HMN0_9AGAR|nr:hypothetical protein DFP72DRAFT_911892 [Tulosesus angulatus]